MKNNIQAMLDKKSMTQGEFAKRVGVRREYINRIIKGNITPTVPLGMRIASALGLFIEEVFILE